MLETKYRAKYINIQNTSERSLIDLQVYDISRYVSVIKRHCFKDSAFISSIKIHCFIQSSKPGFATAVPKGSLKDSDKKKKMNIVDIIIFMQWFPETRKLFQG